MSIRALSLNMDAWFQNRKRNPSSFLSEHESFFQQLRHRNEGFEETVVFMGSHIQSQAALESTEFHNQEFYFRSYLAINQHLTDSAHGTPCTLDGLMLADICDDLPAETSYSRVAGYHNYEGEHASCFLDRRKAGILYAQMHKLATENPTEPIDFESCGHTEETVKDLCVFFGKYPELIPANLVLKLQHHDKTFTIIFGTGIIDANYRQTVRDMVALALDNSHRSQYPTLVDCMSFTRPELLTNRIARKQTPEEIGFYPELDTFMHKANAWAEAVRITPEKQEKYQDGIFAANNLHQAIKFGAKMYFASFQTPKDKEVFRNLCTESIAAARPALEKHRVLNKGLANLCLAIAGLGIGFVIAGLINLAVSKGKHFLFFTTDSERKLDALEDNVKGMTAAAA